MLLIGFYTSTDEEDPAAGPSAITLIHFPGHDTPFNIDSNVEEKTSAAMLPANVIKQWCVLKDVISYLLFFVSSGP